MAALRHGSLRSVGIARLTQSAERKALNLVVVGSSPTVGAIDITERSGEEEDKGGWGGKGEQGKEERRRRRGGRKRGRNRR